MYRTSETEILAFKLNDIQYLILQNLSSSFFYLFGKKKVMLTKKKKKVVVLWPLSHYFYLFCEYFQFFAVNQVKPELFMLVSVKQLIYNPFKSSFSCFKKTEISTLLKWTREKVQSLESLPCMQLLVLGCFRPAPLPNATAECASYSCQEQLPASSSKRLHSCCSQTVFSHCLNRFPTPTCLYASLYATLLAHIFCFTPQWVTVQSSSLSIFVTEKSTDKIIIMFLGHLALREELQLTAMKCE